MKEIALTRGQVAIVDDEDYEALSVHKWCAWLAAKTREFYAVRRVGTKMVSMHRILLCAPPEMLVDHINRNGLDNRRDNLRLATYAQNGRNRTISRNNKSGYKGVHWAAASERWRAVIYVDGKSRHLGWFDTVEEGHAAYCVAAKEHYGEFARFA